MARVREGAPDPEPPGHTARPTRLLAFGVLTAGVVVALLVAGVELGTRYLYLGGGFVPGLPMGRPVEATAVHHPDLGWVNRPGVRTRVEAPAFQYTVTHNSKGWRGPERPYAKPAGIQRVVVLGDSMTWGWGVDDGQEFVALGERALGSSVEFINLGVPGYSTDQQLWLLEGEGARYQPDLVLLCFILNDVTGNSTYDGGSLAQLKPRYRRGPDGQWVLSDHPVPPPTGAERTSLVRRIYANSAFMQTLFPPDPERQLAEAGARAVGDRGRTTRSEAELGEGERDALRHQDQMIRRLCDELVEPDAITHHLLGQLAQRCRELGAPLVVFSVPHHHDRYLYSSGFPRPEGIERHLEPGAPEFETHLTRRLREASQTLGFEVFSIDQVLLEEVTKGHDLHVGDGHLNARGNQLVAERIAEELGPRLQALKQGK